MHLCASTRERERAVKMWCSNDPDIKFTCVPLLCLQKDRCGDSLNCAGITHKPTLLLSSHVYIHYSLSASIHTLRCINMSSIHTLRLFSISSILCCFSSHLYMRVAAHTYATTGTNTGTRTHIHAHTYTHTHTCMNKYTLIYTHKHVHAQTQTHTHTHAHERAHRRTHIAGGTE